MSPVGTATALVIETRRTARTKTTPSGNDIYINNLSADLGTAGRDGTGSRGAKQPRNLSRRGAERTVPFRHNAGAPTLNAAFVAQLLGQVMPDHARPLLRALAAYEPEFAPAMVCDRRL